MNLFVFGRRLAAVAALCAATLVAFSQEFNVPDGWKSVKNGNDYVLTPTQLESGKKVVVIVKPAESVESQSLRNWTLDHIKADQPTRGKLVQDSDLQDYQGGTISAVTKMFQETGGAKSLVYYVGFRRADGQHQMTVTIFDASQETVNQYTKIASKVTADLLRAKSSTPSKPLPPKKDEANAYTTAPGKGVQPSQIEGIYMYQTTEAGVGGYIYIVYRLRLFLKDGWYWKKLSVPPYDLDVAKSRALEPKEWGRWKREGGKIVTQDADGSWSPPRLIPADPGSAQDALSGDFSHLGGGGNVAYGGGTMIAVSKTVTFKPGGKFEWARSVGASSPGVVTTSSGNSQGTYRIDGYVIVLKFNDGHVERHTFAYMDSKKKDAIYIDDTVYLKDKN